MTKELAKGAALTVTNITKETLPFLNDKVKKALENKVPHALELNDDGSVKYKVIYFGTQVIIPEIGIKKVCERLNEVSQDVDILGFLGEIIKYPLHKPEDSLQEFLILAYIAVNPDSYCKLVDSKFTFPLGGAPDKYLETVEDLEKAGVL